MSMNLANLINDGKLKKSFMVATLVSTLLGTFTAAATLHDKYQEKKFQAKQKNTDDTQDKQIQALKKDVERMQLAEERDRLSGKNTGSERSQSQSQSQSQSVSRRQSQRGRRGSVDAYGASYDDSGSDDFDRQAQKSRAMIAREYDENVRRLGQRYAEGDVITENKLQGQIITLQQTVIDVLQDALVSGRKLTDADIRRLIAAQEEAKQGSLEAMRDQYQRMLVDGTRRSSVQEDTQNSSRQLTYTNTRSDSQQDDSFPPPRRVRTLPANLSSSSASSYCRYASDLQSSSRTIINSAFASQGSQRCPACSVRVAVSTKDVWVFETQTPLPQSQQDDKGNLVELRKYTMDARMVLKSHTTDGDFACAICYQDTSRDADCHCSSVEALVKHIGRDHTREDYEREVDIWRD